MKLLNDPMVKLLIDKFDLETPPINVLEISKYELDGDCIKIKEIKDSYEMSARLATSR